MWLAERTRTHNLPHISTTTSHIQAKAAFEAFEQSSTDHAPAYWCVAFGS